MKDLRINYWKDGDIFIGQIVNFESIIFQGKDVEELEKKAKILLKAWLKHWQEILEKKDISIEAVLISEEEQEVLMMKEESLFNDIPKKYGISSAKAYEHIFENHCHPFGDEGEDMVTFEVALEAIRIAEKNMEP